jgi:hypothetical protein
MRRFSMIALSFFLWALASSGGPSIAEEMKAQMAQSFVDSIGIVTHIPSFDSPYGQYAEIVKPRLMELGVHHIRDGLPLMMAFSEKAIRFDNIAVLRILDLSKYGVKTTLFWSGQPISVVKAFAKYMAKALDAVEGPNEPDLPQSNFSYKEQKGIEGAKVFQKDLYEAMKGEEGLRVFPVLSFSLGSINIEGQGVGNIEEWCDYCNIHVYPPAGEPPGSSIEASIRRIRAVAPNKPIICTEAGYTTVGENGISENAHARYILRLLLEGWRTGIQRTFIYELVDGFPKELPRSGFGLIRFDGTPRPAFYALKNMIDILKDPGQDFQTGTLDISMEGGAETVHHILLQKRDGTFYLVLWNEVKSFDPVKKKDISVKEGKVKLTLNSPISQAALYLPLKSPSPVRKIANPKAISLSVPDHPLIVELKP